LVGWLGGSVYHAFRAHWVWLAMDILPIIALCVAAAVYLWLRVLPKWWHTLLVVPPFLLVQRLTFWMVRARHIQLPRNIAIGVSYSTMALLILAPALLVLRKHRWRDWRWPAAGVVCFLAALWSRAADANPPALLAAIGTHWLWHLFGAAAAFCVSVYLYKLRRDELREQAPQVRQTPAAIPTAIESAHHE